jgi:hypothetical protein
MKRRDLSRQVHRVTDVVEPGDFAVRGVEEGNTKFTVVSVRAVQAACIPLRLCKYILRTDRKLLRFDHSDRVAVEVQDVVSGTRIGRMFLRPVSGRSHPFPAERIEPRIDPALSRLPLAFFVSGHVARVPVSVGTWLLPDPWKLMIYNDRSVRPGGTSVIAERKSGFVRGERQELR